ncbi:hypothetical protein KTR10_02070 [Candidatus Kaiserbacteria bacterium]|nr:hypothetical protein [Candidatus Kaiserbacteria bacterium]
MTNLVNQLGAYAHEKGEDVRFILFKFAFYTLIATTVMWSINLAGFLGVNVALSFIGLIALGLHLTNTTIVFTAMGLGAIVQGLNDEDITQGAVEGAQILYKGALGILFFFTFSASVLSTWSFEENPGAFWVIALMGIVLGLLTIWLGEGSKKYLKWVVTAYAVYTIFVNILSTIPFSEFLEEEKAASNTQQTVTRAYVARRVDRAVAEAVAEMQKASEEASDTPLTVKQLNGLTEPPAKFTLAFEPHEVTDYVLIKEGYCLKYFGADEEHIGSDVLEGERAKARFGFLFNKTGQKRQVVIELLPYKECNYS